MAKNEKEQQSENNGHNITKLSQLRDNITIYGKPVFKFLEIDNETGNISYALNEAIESELNKTSHDILKAAETGEHINLLQMEGAPQKIIEIIEGIIKSNPDYETLKEWQGMFEDFYNATKSGQELLEEMRDLRPYIDAELERTNIKILNEEGREINDFRDLAGSYTLGELLNMLDDPDSDLSNLMNTARAARDTALTNVFRMQEGKIKRQTKRDMAKSSGAVMNVTNNALLFFSDPLFVNAFSPQNIDIMAGLENEKDIEPDTGEIKLNALEKKERQTPAAVQIPINFLGLLAAIMASKVENKREEEIIGNKVTFYVDGVLKQITDDPRILYGRQVNMLDGKDPGEQYIEEEIGKLVKYIGKIGNSRYSIISFESYDAKADTITVRMPYLYELLKRTQNAYFKNQKQIAEAKENNKKIKKKDQAPPKTNELFKTNAFTVNQTTLQIAVYITNKMLQAGSGKDKYINIKFKTLIAECPLIKERLEELERLPRKEKTKEGKIINNQNKYNAELKKIESAIDLILNPKKCRATDYYNIHVIQPSKNDKFLAPTKSRLDEVLHIEWDTKKGF